MTRLSPETIDGLEFEMRLAANPVLAERTKAFWARVAAFREKTAGKSKSEMIADLKADCPAYILELLEADSEAGIRDRYVMTFHSKDPRP